MPTKKELRRLLGEATVSGIVSTLPDPVKVALSGARAAKGNHESKDNRSMHDKVIDATIASGAEIVKQDLAEKSPGFLNLFKKGNIVALTKNAYIAAASFIRNKLYFDPLVETIRSVIENPKKETFLLSLERGARKGIDNSTFGLTNFSDLPSSNYNKMLTKAAIEWKLFLAKNPKIRRSPTTHKRAYEEFIERGVEKALRSDTGLRRIDLIIPSFEEVEGHMRKNLGSLNKEVNKLRKALIAKTQSPKATKRKQRTHSR